MSQRRPDKESSGDVVAAAAEYYKHGELERAERLCAKLLRLDPDNSNALHLAALIADRKGRRERALELLDRAVVASPDDLNAAGSLGRLLVESRRFEPAIPPLQRVAEARPEDSGARYRLGIALKEAGRIGPALEELDAFSRLEPGKPDGWIASAEVQQRANQLDDAARRVDRALEIAPGHPGAETVRAQIDLRRGDREGAARRLRSLLERELHPQVRALAAAWLGRTLDRGGDHAGAFAAFGRANAALAEIARVRESGGIYTADAIERQRVFVSEADPSSWTKPSENGLDPPVFLVGFPRSGTTLLERMLASHPEVSVLDERQTLIDIHRDFTAGRADPGRLHALRSDELARYRQRYRERVTGFLGGDPKRVVVDKMPMNLVFLGLIHRFFPEARVVFVERDPRDVCLSCFMQTFTPNQATANFLDLERTADYYRRCMSLAELSRERLPLELHAIRYESLVERPENHARELVRFLGLEWNDSVMAFHREERDALTRTPSYQQVNRPVYTDSVGRWRRYREQLVPVLPVLEPFVRRMGY